MDAVVWGAFIVVFILYLVIGGAIIGYMGWDE